MDCSCSGIRTLRSTTTTAFLTVLLLGCGNGSAGAAVQQTVELVQDWEIQPKLWSPQAILIPRSQPTPRDTVDSAGGDMRTDSLPGRTSPDTTRVDSMTRVESTGNDSSR